MFLLYARETILDHAVVGLALSLLVQMLNGTYEEAASSASWIKDGLAKSGIDLLDNELRDRARGIELSCITRRLQILENLLVNVAKGMAVIGGIEINAIDLVDYLPHEGAVLHVVVGILKRHSDQTGDL